MKRYIQLAAALLLFAQLFGCSTGGNAPAAAASAPAETTAAATSAPAETTAAATSAPAETTAAATSAPAQKAVELTLPTYRTGQNVGAKFFEPQIARFNEKYAGQYKITLEEVPQDSYPDKMKQLAQQNKLPFILEGGLDDAWFNSVIIANKMFYDLKPWLDANPDIKSELIPDSVKFTTQPDGSIVSMPLIVTRPIGVYYNNTMYKPSKPIGQMSLDEFEASLGSNKIAFMTGENAWTTMLFLSDLIANQPGGPDMLKNHLVNKITDYSDPIFINALTTLQKYLQKYATSNTVGAAYADAANSFMSKNAAVIFNGPWMVGDLSPGSEDKWSNGFDSAQVTADIYPGNVAFANNTGFWFWIPKNQPQEQIDGALAFLGFMASQPEIEAWMLAEGGTAPQIKLSNDYLNKLKDQRLLSEMSAGISSETKIVPAIADNMLPSVASTDFGTLLPKLIDGSLTPEQFAQQLTEKSK